MSQLETFRGLPYTVTVTDTQTGNIKTYRNPRGRFASVGDTQAF